MGEAAAGPYGLNNQEMRVLKLLADGLADQEIAAQLCVTPQALDEHFCSILWKMASRSRTEAAIKAIKQRLLLVGAGALVALFILNPLSAGPPAESDPSTSVPSVTPIAPHACFGLSNFDEVEERNAN